MIDDEKFFAWLDGELDPAEAAEIEARVAANPELSQRADQHRALAARLKHAFDPIAEAPVPERFQSALRRSAEVVDFATVTRPRSMPWLPQWAAIAATLVFGILVGTMVPQRSGGPVTIEAGKLYAASAVNRALDTELASAPQGDVRIGLTFRDRSGQICRSFSAPAASGLACRSGNGWQLKGLFAAPEGQASDYRMAGTDPNVAALVDSTMAGEPLDADSERAALKRHWR
jgi:hypothetical protein